MQPPQIARNAVLAGHGPGSPLSVSEGEAFPRRAVSTLQASDRRADQAIAPIHVVDNQDQYQ